ncbi:MAG TPA: 3-hydroxyacyl-CoA dehydrogenase NAD-binding domain-containing protein [Acidobacteriota bacterium]|nr:3-hydroxyacyl-CoA dehydrogenase NAD-binding domain-containing protein [Acidobacteriota bacterium]
MNQSPGHSETTHGESKVVVGVVGAGTMGRGIAQVAATAGHPLLLYDSDPDVIAEARAFLNKIHDRLVEKGRLSREEADAILARIQDAEEIADLASSSLIVEAIIENLDVKREVFSHLEDMVEDEVLLATNTSSLSVTSVASSCRRPQRVLGAHFFNPAPLMALVEIVPGLATSDSALECCRGLIDSWGKTTVLAKDTPGFIVNRVARPFYGEALRIFDEGIADAATIDWAMREFGDFRMGPFQLMDLIGNDVNLKVTESVFEAFYYDPRFKPSFTQKRMVEAGRLGRKSGRGYYDYSDQAQAPQPNKNPDLGQRIFDRILAMLINEAADAVFMQVASAEDVDLAMTKGVNYPQGLLEWADEIGPEVVLRRIEELQAEYGEDRYRPNPLLRRVVRQGLRFRQSF